MKKLLYILLFVPLALFGQENYSLSFDGENNYINLGNNSSLNFMTSSSFTISSWVYLNPSKTGTIYRIGDGWAMSQNRFININQDLNTITFSIRSTGNSSQQFSGCEYVNESQTTSLVSSEIYEEGWYYISCIRNYDEELILQIDSNIQNTIDNSGSFDFIESCSCCGDEWEGEGIPDHIIGASRSEVSGNWLFNNHFDGIINNFQIWNTILTSNEIYAYMSCPPSGDEEGLICYWNFNEGSGDTVYDISGNDNHGVINGATYSEEVPEQNCDDSFSNELSIIDQLNQSFDAWNTSIDLSSGWNMFGYGCPSSIDVADGLSNYTESIIITKDNNGNVYMPEFGFNGIGDFTPGFGYQIKLTEAIEGFSLCDFYVNDIPEDNIVSLQEENVSLQEEVDFMSQYFGCIDESACNYSPIAIIENESCIYPSYGFNCEGDEINSYEIGEYAHGGIVFYFDSIEQCGLVASSENLQGTYQWGCHGTYLVGSNATSIGSGHQNTMDILSQGCTSDDGDVIAAKATADSEINNFTDWYLPSINELQEMYYTIGPGGSIGNVADFVEYSWYWSSSQYNSNYAQSLNMSFGNINIGADKTGKMRVRPIRAFGNWTMGCMDSLACNFNSEANMSDGSCEYPETGFDCDGNELPQIGDYAYGGIVFYIDETGQHGLVAALADLPGTYEWGCVGLFIPDANDKSIGAGIYNSENIFQYCDESIVNTILYQESGGGYGDWYLPSLNELVEMHFNIGQLSSLSNIGGFENDFYWSSSQEHSNAAWYHLFMYDGDADGYTDKDFSYKVRPIRSF